MPAPNPIAAACIAMYATCGIALAQPIDLWAPPQTAGAGRLAPGGPRSTIAPRLPEPPVPRNDPPQAFLGAARSAVDRGQAGEAQEALERAETRLLDRAVGMNSAQEPDDRRAVLDIGVARQALAAGDRAGTLRAIDDALAAPDLVARRAPPLPATPSQVADVTLPPPDPPPVAYALLPWHWRLEGARYVWVPPATALRRVESRTFIEGSYDWCDGAWRWVPAHYSGN